MYILSKYIIYIHICMSVYNLKKRGQKKTMFKSIRKLNDIKSPKFH